MAINKMKINASKTFSMFGSRQKLEGIILHLSLNGCTIPHADTTKYLSQIIDSHLNWSDYILKKARSHINAILRLRPIPSQLLVRLYRSYVMPIFEYYDTVWQPSLLASNKLDKLLSRTMCKFGWSPNSDLTPSLSSVRHKFHIALQAFKIIHKHYPPQVS